MSTDRDTTRIVRSWLQTDEYESADRVLDVVLDRLDTTPQRRSTWWPARRFPEMNTMAKLGIAAAAVVVAALLGFNYLVAPNVGGPGLGDPTPTPSPTAEATILRTGTVPPGRHFIGAGRFTPLRLDFTVPAGWVAGDAGAVGKNAGDPAEVGLAAFIVTDVYADACDSEGTLTEIGPAADDLVAALTSQRNVEITGPTDVTVGGYQGKRVDVAIPADLDVATCRHGVLIQIWANPAETDFFALPVDYSGSVYVIDVDAERVVLAVNIGPDASAADLAEIEAMMASMSFSP